MNGRRRTALLVTGLALGLRTVRAQAPDSVRYVLQHESRFEVETGNAGLFKFAGHEHVVRARAFAGWVVHYPGDPTRSRMELVVRAESLEVLTPPDTEEIRKVTAAMRTDVLDIAHHPEIRFVSTAVNLIPGGLRVLGNLTIVGVTREASCDVRLGTSADTLRASGTFSIKQTDFGIRPYRAGPGGVVAVANRVTFRFDAVGLRAAGR